jgi:thiol:disulfide interchange protein DsbC
MVFGLAGVGVAEQKDTVPAEAIKQALPQVPIASIDPAPVPGMFQVVTNSGDIFYVDQKAKHIFTGDLLAIEAPGKFANLSEAVRGEQRVKLMKEVDATTAVTFAAKGEKKGEIFVFTDPDCGYCRKLHTEVPELTALGVEVHYLAWPRAGVESGTGKKMSNIWCAEDQLGAMDLAKQGKNPPDQESCEHPIKEHLELGVKLGVRGTPAIFLSDGRQIGGYKAAKAIAEDLGI